MGQGPATPADDRLGWTGNAEIARHSRTYPGTPRRGRLCAACADRADQSGQCHRGGKESILAVGWNDGRAVQPVALPGCLTDSTSPIAVRHLGFEPGSGRARQRSAPLTGVFGRSPAPFAQAGLSPLKIVHRKNSQARGPCGWDRVHDRG